MSKPRYKNHPLVEAIYELFAEGPTRDSDDPQTTVWDTSSVSRLFANFADFALHEERMQDFGWEVSVGPDGIAKRTAHEPRERVRRWNESKTLAVQFGRHMCAHNVLGAAYQHFDPDHVPVVERVIRAYLDEAKPVSLAWIGQRYINKIDILDGDPAAYFTIYPQLPTTLSGHRPFALQLETLPFSGGQVMVSLRLHEQAEGQATYILDVYARSNGKIPTDPQALLAWHREAHVAVSDSFELSVTAKSRQLFNGELG